MWWLIIIIIIIIIICSHFASRLTAACNLQPDSRMQPQPDSRIFISRLAPRGVFGPKRSIKSSAMFPLDVCGACGRRMTNEEESVCWTCTLCTFRTSVANLSATSPAASKAELILRQRLLHFFVPYWYPTTLRDIRVARQRWRLEVLLTGKPHGFRPTASILEYRWCHHGDVISTVIDFVYPKLQEWRSDDGHVTYW